MNKKVCELLSILINSPNQYFRYEDLARLLSVSTRSIRNYISDISYFLSGQSLSHFIDITNRGIAFIGSNKDVDILSSHLIDTDFYFYKLSSEERVNIIALTLLLSEKACTISALAEKFNASRVTIIKDIEQVRFLVSQYHIIFEASTHHGYRLMALEKDRRDLILKIIFDSGTTHRLYASHVNLYEFFMNEVYFKGSVHDNYSEVLRKAEDVYDISVSDSYYEKVLLCMKLIKLRIESGFYLTLDAGEIQQMKRLKVYLIAEYILTALKVNHDSSITDSETAYFAYKLYEYHFYNVKIIEDNRCIQTHMVIHSFLDKVGEELMIPLSDDSLLNEQLGNHLNDMKKVHNSKTSMQNDFREQIIKEYYTYYELIWKSKKMLEDHFGYQFNKDDIAYIILYIVVSIERYFEGDTIPKAIVVCHTGIGTANFLVEELKANFNIKILTVTSTHKLTDELSRYDYDLIISTVSVPNDLGNWIKVNPMLDDNDILGLQRILYSIKRDKRKSIMTKMQNKKKKEGISATYLQRLEQVLTLDHILLDVNCVDWREAIYSAGRILLNSGSITEQYIQAIENSVVTNGAYFVFCPGIALAHAGPDDGVLRFDISLLRLHTPINFGHKTNDPVRYIICFSSTYRIEDANLVLKLMNVISSIELQQQLDSDHDKSLFHKHIIEYGGVS